MIDGVPEELHDERGVLVAVLVESVQLGYRIIEGLLSQRTGLNTLVVSTFES